MKLIQKRKEKNPSKYNAFIMDLDITHHKITNHLFAVYIILVQSRGKEWIIMKRNQDFQSLYSLLKAHYKPHSKIQIPKIKRNFNLFNRLNWEFLIKRRDHLNQFLLQITNSDLEDSSFVLDFLSNSNTDLSIPKFYTNRLVYNTSKITINDFELKKVIGQGSYGKVVLGKRQQEYYAIKIIAKKTLDREYRTKRIKAERDLLKSLNHTFILDLKYAFQTSRNIYLATPYIEGGNLYQLVQKQGRISSTRARFYIAEISLAINYLHESNVIYRDLKPENIMLCRDGHVKLIDFGLARTVKHNYNDLYSLCGTPAYIAPELVESKLYNKSVDWYSLGIVFYELLVGFPPFYSNDIYQLYNLILYSSPQFPDVSENAKSLILSLICKNPNKRAVFDDIVNSKFFNGLDWGLLESKLIPAPYMPTVKYIDPRSEHKIKASKSNGGNKNYIKDLTVRSNLFKDF